MGFNVNNTTFPGPLDLLFPHYCRGCGALGSPLCERCKNNIILGFSNFCPNCKDLCPSGTCSKCGLLPPTFVVGNRTDLVGKLAYDLKFHSIRALAEPLAGILNEIIPKIGGEVVIVPLPTIRPHIRQRGLDHTLVVAKHFSKIRGDKYRVVRLLYRNSHAIQVGADRKTRLKQASSAYRIDSSLTIDSNATYIVFDDIWTTGASIKAAVRLLKAAGVKKIVVAILAVSRIEEK